MIKLEILGTGCPKCKKLYEVTEAAAKEMEIDYSIEKIDDIAKIMEYGVMMIPALVVNDEVKIMGKVPNINEIKKILN